jgi:hypothetical protein
LGTRDEVLWAIGRGLSVHRNNNLALSFNVDDENVEPITISVMGIWGEDERAVLKDICNLLAARFYESEAGDFVDL